MTTKSKDDPDSLDTSISNVLDGAQEDTHGTDNPGAQLILKQPGTRANPDLLEMSLCKQVMRKNFWAAVKKKHKYCLILLR